MESIKDILAKSNPADIISALKEKSVTIRPWSDLVKDYDPRLHKIVKDPERGKKVRGDKVIDPSKITIALEQLLSRRYTQFTFSIPVTRNYLNLTGATDEITNKRNEIAKAIEAVYKSARIDAVNSKRGLNYYASCEVCTMWYAVKSKNSLYGFDSEYKLKCNTYSPMEGVALYPLFDENEDMVAMSFEYIKKVKDENVSFFETYTSEGHYQWKNVDNKWEKVEISEINKVQKIPCIYTYRKQPVYEGLTEIREEIEYTLSRNSDVIAYNSAPILKVVGELKGFESKEDSRRIFRVQNGGDVSYVSWSQSVESLKYQIDKLFNLFWMQSQMPDISFDSMVKLGNIGYDARQTVLTDSHLRINDEANVLVESLERECNVIKAFLKAINVKDKLFVQEIDNVTVEHIITPYRQNDEKAHIENIMTMNGGKPLISHKDSIRMGGYTTDAEETYNTIREEQSQENDSRMESVFGGGAV